MLGDSGGGLITKITSLLTVPEKAPVPDVPPSTPVADDEPYSSLAAATTNDVNKSGALAAKPAKRLPGVSPRRSITRSASELVVPTQTRDEQKSARAALNAVRFKEDERLRSVAKTSPKSPATQSQRSLQSPRPAAKRSVSNSQMERRSGYHDPAISSASLQKQLVQQTKPASRARPVRPSQTGRLQTAGVSVSQTRPNPTRSTAVRSSSDPDLAKAFANPKTRNRDGPLKPCIKSGAKSATTTPPSGYPKDVVESEPMPLRRVKTVDFEENGSKPSQSLLQVAVTSENPTKSSTNDVEPPLAPTAKPKKTVKRIPSCPNTMGTLKSSVADPATTKTAVHVIAIAPAWNAKEVTNEEGGDPATPTMQIIESKSGSYEVIWDDVPSEHSIRLTGRRSSAAGHALEAASPSAKLGLGRVNTKLTDWSNTWNAQSESFKPTIVVFPDDDGRATRYDCSVEDDDNLQVSAPPNSQLTSAAPSRFPSRPASAPITRVASCEEISYREALEAILPDNAHSLVVPDSEVQPGAGRKSNQAVAVRKLSNMEEADVKFRGHRDSVTIAHSRLVQSGGISPELFAHRDSVSIAKKRMHAKNHAASTARQMPRRNPASIEALNLVADDDVPEVSLPAIKEHAAQALKNKTSGSMLHSGQRSPSHRHIRIVECATLNPES
jgi:hypothetical protein